MKPTKRKRTGEPTEIIIIIVHTISVPTSRCSVLFFIYMVHDMTWFSAVLFIYVFFSSFICFWVSFNVLKERKKKEFQKFEQKKVHFLLNPSTSLSYALAANAFGIGLPFSFVHRTFLPVVENDSFGCRISHIYLAVSVFTYMKLIRSFRRLCGVGSQLVCLICFSQAATQTWTH